VKVGLICRGKKNVMNELEEWDLEEKFLVMSGRNNRVVEKFA
jgi:hypothetical protein